MKFTIEVDMKDRWVEHFISMLKRMELMGSWGSSRILGFYADGDGDFRPKFDFSGIEGIEEVNPVYDDNIPTSEKDAVCDVFYDAG
jgi:hypothetical protein